MPDGTLGPLFAVVGVVVQFLRKLEHKGTVVRQVTGIALGGIERGGSEGVQKAVAVGTGRKRAFLNAAVFAGPCTPDLSPECVLVVVLEHNGKAGSVVEGTAVDFKDVARYPRRIDGFVAVAEPPAFVSPGAFDM